VPRRLLSLAALVLAVSLAAGCGDGGAPAARVGDTMEISNDELLTETAEWAASPALLSQVGVTSPEGDAPGSFSTSLVDVVLTNRIRFDLHREQFDALGLSVDPANAAEVEEQLAPVLGELSPGFATLLVDDLVRVTEVTNAMADDYEAWFTGAMGGDIEISSRYGRWDGSAAAVVPPEGPRPAPADLLVGP
jgi:hypothetical protein